MCNDMVRKSIVTLLLFTLVLGSAYAENEPVPIEHIDEAVVEEASMDTADVQSDEITTEPTVEIQPLEMDAAEAEDDSVGIDDTPVVEEPLDEDNDGKVVVEGNNTLGGVNGYVVLPSALPLSSEGGPALATGYQAIWEFPSNFAHIPYIQFGFLEDFETSLAVDIDASVDLLLNGKWRFLERGTTSVAFGFIGQALDLGNTNKLAAHTYFASTFSSNFINWPSKTTILIGYTFSDTLNSNIDFGMGFQAPLLQKMLKGKVDFLIDFGNVSYSMNPSAGDASDRGMLNVGLRVLPIEFMRGTFVTFDLRVLDLLDDKGRGVSAGMSIAFRP